MRYDRCNRLREALNLLSSLLLSEYFDRFDVLDSDGRKLLARIGKILAPVDSRLSTRAYSLLREPSREALLRLHEELDREYNGCLQ